MTGRRVMRSAVILAGAVAVAAARSAAQEPLAALPEIMDRVRSEWGVPGVAVAVVHGDRTVFSGGAGTLGVRDPRPVTAKTLFNIGSTTKSFTAATAALMVDEGLLSWDRPVRSVLPEFHLRDGKATLNATLKDLLAHRTGLPRYDALWYRSGLDRSALIRRLRFLESSAPFRDRFQYSNLTYMVAGSMIGKAAGTSWETEVSRRLLSPLGMKRTSFERAPKAETDVALPHRLGPPDVALPVSPYTGWAIGPALSMVSSAEDLTRWIDVQLHPGTPDEPKPLTRDLVETLHQPVVVVPVPATRESPQTSYALGWFVQTYRGRLVLYHTGAIDGFYSLVAVMPLEDIGVVVLTNRSRNRVPEVLSRWVFDRLLGLSEIDWNRRLQLEHRAVLELERAEWSRIEALKDLGIPSTAGPEALIGTYEHPAFGPLEVEFGDQGELNARFRDLRGWLEHLNGETYVFHFDAEGLGDRFTVTFAPPTEGRSPTLAARLQGGVPPATFQRVEDVN